MGSIRYGVALGVAAAAFIGGAGTARAHHGPETTGQGSSSESGQVLKQGTGSLSLRWDYTHFESLSETEIQEKTRRAGGDHAHVDALEWSGLQTLDLEYGAAEDFQLGFSIGWYRGDNLREGHIHGNGSYGFHRLGDVSGATDFWIQGKYRFLHAEKDQAAFFGGVKLPTGRDDVRGNKESTPLDPSIQPGSGAFDFLAGLSWSRQLAERTGVEAAVQYLYRTEANDFKVGDRADASVRLTRTLSETGTFPRWSVFGQASVRCLFKNEEGGSREDNTGGTTVFVSPGALIGFTDRLSLSVAPEFPVLQELNGEQQETVMRVVAELTFTF